MTVLVTPVDGKMRPDDLRDVALVVADKRQEIVEEAAPLPYTTATLLEDAVQLPGWSTAKAMQTAQILFENGLITYPRSDSTHVAPEAADEGRHVASLIYGAPALHSRKELQYTQISAHEAIRPTSAARLPDELPSHCNTEMRTLYRLIWERYMATYLKPARYRVTTVFFEVEG